MNKENVRQMSNVKKRKSSRTYDDDLSSQNSQISQSLAVSQEPNALNEKRKRMTRNNDPQTPKKRFSTTNAKDLNMLNDANESSIADNSQFSQSTSIRAPCTGVIEKIYLKNFKCHSLLKFELHPYINFILGLNGSGKSAVMDAITLCLGGRATTTGRQASAKTFIKTNCDRAELSITLTNTGPEAYKPQDYGKSITIERRIQKDGASQYKLLNEDNRSVSTKKQEVDSIREAFNIQVDNPVCFLNQETSKHFLNSSTESTKYQFFMKASQIEQIKKLLESIIDQRSISLKIIEDKESEVPKLEEELYNAEVKWKTTQSLDKLRQKECLLHQEFTWSVVILNEKNLKVLEDENQSFVNRKEKLEFKMKEMEKKFEESNSEHNQYKNEIKTLTNKSNLHEKEYDQAENAYRISHIAYKSTQNEVKRHKTQLERKTNEYNQLSAKHEEERSKTTETFEEEKKQKSEKIEMIQKEMGKSLAVEKRMMRDIGMYKSTLDHSEQEMSDKRFEIKNYERVIQNLQLDVTNLEKSEKDRIQSYGPAIANVVAEVKRLSSQRKFKFEPKFVGLHVNIKQFKYALAVEACIGNLLSSFICENYADEKLLYTIINKHMQKQKPRVTVMDFNTPLYDVRRFRPEANYPTVYEMLEVDDHIVANYLIDSGKVDCILLLPDSSHTDVIEHHSTPNCNQAYLENGDQLLGLPSFRFFANARKETRYFVRNTQEAVRQKKLEIENNRRYIPELEERINHLFNEVGSTKQLKEQNDKQHTKIKRDHLKLQQQLTKAEAIVIPEPFDLVALVDELTSTTEEIKDYESKIKEINDSSSDQRTAYEDTKSALDLLTKEKGDFDREIVDIQKRVRNTDETRGKLQDYIEHYKNNLKDVEPKLYEKEQLIEKSQTSLENVTSAALDMCERINTRRLMGTIEIELTAVGKQIEKSSRMNGDHVEIARVYREKKDIFKAITSQLAKHRAWVERLKAIMDNRLSETHQFISSKALRCAIKFNQLLKSRNYKGELIFDHEEQKLKVDVQPNGNDQNKRKDNNSDNQDLKSLSGGERSFSTVAFLLSLWSIVESPILFLDEFDVFMDQVNRRFAMELILDSAKDNLNGQYLFLTPQEMGYIKPDVYVKLFKMPDPKRPELNDTNLPRPTIESSTVRPG